MKKKDLVHLIVFVVALFTGIIVFNYYGDPTSGATVSLAFITAYYAWQTQELVKENRRMINEIKVDRYINFLNKRLEKLYTPFSNVGTELLYVLREMLMGELGDIKYYNDLRELNKKLEDIKPYTYLASNKLKKDLEAFLLKLSTFIIDFELIKYQDKVQEELTALISKLDKILSIIDEEIKEYRNELTELIETRHF